MRVALDRPGDGRSRRRIVVGIGAAFLTLAVAVAAGLSSPADGGAPVLLIERLSSTISDLASGSNVWWIYALLLGAVAAFNPCGFALVPAYLGLYLNDEDGGGAAARLRRALRVGAAVTAAFTVLFGAIGAVFSLASSLLVRSLPWAGLAVGVLLIVVGGLILSGRSIVIGGPERTADRLGGRASGEGVRAYAAFGLAFGLASLGCALPLFLALVGTAVAAGGPFTAILAFVLYGAGMAAVLCSLTLAAALVRFGVLSRVRAVARFVKGVSGVLLLASGGYVVFYWLTAGRLLLG